MLATTDFFNSGRSPAIPPAKCAAWSAGPKAYEGFWGYELFMDRAGVYDGSGRAILTA